LAKIQKKLRIAILWDECLIYSVEFIKNVGKMYLKIIYKRDLNEL